MRNQIEEAIKTVRPALQADGGDIELVDVVDGVAQVRLKGACSGCPHAALTLKEGVERQLKRAVPELKRVEAVK